MEAVSSQQPFDAPQHRRVIVHDENGPAVGQDVALPANSPDLAILHLITSPSYWPYVQWEPRTPLWNCLGTEITLGVEHAEPLRVRDKFGKGVHLHLLHHLVAMRFDGALGRSQLMGDLLVDLAANDQTEHLPLSRRQGSYESAKGIEFALLIACGFVSRQGSLDRIDQKC